MTLLGACLDHLRVLVATPTENPPRAVSALPGVLAGRLPKGATLEVTDLGEGCLILFVARGSSKLVFNAHLDTVPRGDGWTRDPFELLVDRDRAVGLGACDIKGGAAAMLAAAAATDAPFAFAFTTDEEAGSARCASAFAESAKTRFDGVIVAEPTRTETVTSHRGVATARGRFHGIAGHSSNAYAKSAVHEAARWVVRAADRAGSWAESGGLRFNAGRIEGGEKPNVVAAECEVRFGVRPPTGVDPASVIDVLTGLSAGDVTWTRGFTGPALPAPEAERTSPERLVEALGAPVGAPVDFWTEAAIFSANGLPAVVFGPGDIQNAHAKDESVLLEELERAAGVYLRAIERGATWP